MRTLTTDTEPVPDIRGFQWGDGPSRWSKWCQMWYIITRIVQVVSNMTHCVSCFPTLLYLGMEMKCYILGICFNHSMNRDHLECH